MLYPHFLSTPRNYGYNCHRQWISGWRMHKYGIFPFGSYAYCSYAYCSYAYCPYPYGSYASVLADFISFLFLLCGLRDP